MAKGTTSDVTRKTARQVVAGKTAGTAGTAGTAADVTPRAAQAATAEDVARRAYEIYLEEGSPEGRQLEHWRRAESELRTGRGAAS